MNGCDGTGPPRVPQVANSQGPGGTADLAVGMENPVRWKYDGRPMEVYRSKKRFCSLYSQPGRSTDCLYRTAVWEKASKTKDTREMMPE